jgi:hypothetical protein
MLNGVHRQRDNSKRGDTSLQLTSSAFVSVIAAVFVVLLVVVLQIRQEKEAIGIHSRACSMGQVICPPSQSARDTAPDDAVSNNNMSGSRGDAVAAAAAAAAAAAPAPVPAAAAAPAPAPAAATSAGTTSSHNIVLVDYLTVEYKGFVFVIHEQYGLMLLYCTRKKKKPPHWQLCGGKIDEHEFIQAGKKSRNA